MQRLLGQFVRGRGAIGLLILRLVAGSALMLHGWPKIQHAMSWMGSGAPVPGIFQFLAAFSESFGGLAFHAGLLTPIAALGVATTMLFTGPGAISLDALLFGKRRQIRFDQIQ